MSPDSEVVAERAKKRLVHATRDIREAVRTAATISNPKDPDAWTRAASHGWSPAECSLHLALVAERSLQELKVVAAHGALAHPRRQTLRQRASFRVLLWTWNLPQRVRAAPGTDPTGVLPTPKDVMRRHTRWAADFLAFLGEHPAMYLVHIRATHPEFGEIDVFEWARFLAILARACDLRAATRS